MKYAEAAGTGTTRAHQKWMLARMKDIILTQKGPAAIGKLNPKSYETVGKALKEYSLIEQIPKLDEFYKGPR